MVYEAQIEVGIVTDNQVGSSKELGNLCSLFNEIGLMPQLPVVVAVDAQGYRIAFPARIVDAVDRAYNQIKLGLAVLYGWHIHKDGGERHNAIVSR